VLFWGQQQQQQLQQQPPAAVSPPLPSPTLPHTPSPPPGATLTLSRLIFRNDADENPPSLALLITPNFVTLQPGAALAVNDAGKVMGLPAKQAAAVFDRVLSAPDVQRARQTWKYTIYTVRSAVGGWAVCGWQLGRWAGSGWSIDPQQLVGGRPTAAAAASVDQRAGGRAPGSRAADRNRPTPIN
jgi:hypothetical protein